ncbi:MAG: hypothetical protein NUW37_11220 [Planctomycetes bacterium]|nr:hypothetical protein [Planctomycetota bacterium]
MRRSVNNAFAAAWVILAVTACEEPSGLYLPGGAQDYIVDVSAESPTFKRDTETASFWQGTTSTQFSGAVSMGQDTDFGMKMANGMSFKLHVEALPAHVFEKESDGMWMEHHTSGATHHIRLEVSESLSGHSPHGHESIPTHIHDGAIYVSGTTTDPLVEEIEWVQVMQTHGFRYIVNLDLDSVLTDGQTYDIVAKIEEPEFMRDHELNEIWKGDTTVTFTGTWSTASGFTLTTSNVVTADFDATLSSSSSLTSIFGEANLGIPTGADTRLVIKLIVDENTTSMEEEAKDAGGRLFMTPITVTLTAPDTGGVKTVTLEPIWSEHHGFYYGANVALPLVGNGTPISGAHGAGGGEAAGGGEEGGHSH